MRPLPRRVLEAAIAAAVLAAALGNTWAVRTRVWTEPSVDLLRGEADGVAVTSRGRLFATPRWIPLAESGAIDSAPYVWSVALRSSGDLFLGTGPEGRIFRITPAGEMSPFFRADAALVTALAVLPDGDLVAGTAPEGRIYRISADGQGKLWCETGERYVWSLAVAADGTVFAGTGEQGVVFRIDREGNASPFFDADDSHVVALVPMRDGGLIAGGASRGTVYRVYGDGNARVLLDDDLAEARALAVSEDGTVVAALMASPEPEARPPAVRIQMAGGGDVTPPDRVAEVQERPGGALEGIIEGLPAFAEERGKKLRGKVVRLSPDGVVTELWRSNTEAPYTLALDAEKRVVFGTGEPARIYRVEGPDEVALLATLREGQVTGLVAGPRGGFVAATSNPGRAYRLERDRKEPGVFLSRPFDTGTLSRWGSLRWDQEGTAGRAELYTRSGNTAYPDPTWSGWSAALTDPAENRCPSPAGRYVQWRARFPAPALADLRLSTVSLGYAALNRPPAMRDLRLDAPLPALNGKATLRWSAMDPDGDPLAIEIELRRAGTTEWTPVAKAELAAAPADSSGDDDGSWREGKAVWDTVQTPEGAYDVRGVARDRASNAAGEGTQTTVDLPVRVTVDRTPPSIDAKWVRGDTLEVVASDAGSPVLRLELVRDKATLFLLPVSDGVADSRTERFVLRRADLGGEAVEGLTLRATDAAGNAAEAALPAP